MSQPKTLPIVPLTHAKPGDHVIIGPDRGTALLLAVAPNGDMFLQPTGYPSPRHIITINPSAPPATLIVKEAP